MPPGDARFLFLELFTVYTLAGHLVKVPLKRVTPTISKTIPQATESQSLIMLTPFEFWKALEASLKLRSTHLITGVPIIMKRE